MSAADDSALLKRLLAAVEELEYCLEAETRVLIDGDVGELLGAVERKRRAVQAVEQAMRESHVHADPAAHPARQGRADAKDVRSRLERTPEWPALLARLDHCRMLNQAAGGAIAASRRGTEELLRALGHAPAGATYDGGGNTTTGGNSRGIAVC